MRNEARYLFMALAIFLNVCAMQEEQWDSTARDSMDENKLALLKAYEGNLEDSIKKTSLNDNDNPVQHFFDCKDQPYSDFKKILQKIVPELRYTQNQQHNPLIRAVQAQDVEFIEFLLKHGANPLFRGTDFVNAFDAANICTSEDFSSVQKTASLSEIFLLLKKYIPAGEVYTPFPAKSINPWYKEKINIQEWFRLHST